MDLWGVHLRLFTHPIRWVLSPSGIHEIGHALVARWYTQGVFVTDHSVVHYRLPDSRQTLLVLAAGPLANFGAAMAASCLMFLTPIGSPLQNLQIGVLGGLFGMNMSTGIINWTASGSDGWKIRTGDYQNHYAGTTQKEVDADPILGLRYVLWPDRFPKRRTN